MDYWFFFRTMTTKDHKGKWNRKTTTKRYRGKNALHTLNMDVNLFWVFFFTNFSLYTYHTCILDFIVHDHDHGHRRHDHPDHHELDKVQDDFHSHRHYLRLHHNYHYFHPLKKKKRIRHSELIDKQKVMGVNHKNKLNLPSSTTHWTTTTTRLLWGRIWIISTSTIILCSYSIWTWIKWWWCWWNITISSTTTRWWWW